MMGWKTKTLLRWLDDLVHNQGGIELMALCTLFFSGELSSFKVRFFGFAFFNVGINAFEVLFLMFKGAKTFPPGGKATFVSIFFADVTLFVLGMWSAMTRPQVIDNRITQASLFFLGVIGFFLIIRRVRKFVKEN